MLQQILLRIHQYRVKIIYKPWPDLFMADCLSRQNHKENKHKEVTGMQISINAIQSITTIPEFMSRPTPPVLHGICHTRVAWKQKPTTTRHKDILHIQRDDMAVIDGVVIKGRYIVISETLQQEALKQLDINHMGIEKTLGTQICILDRYEYGYWKPCKNCSTCLNFQQTQPKEKWFIMIFQANHGKW